MTRMTAALALALASAAALAACGPTPTPGDANDVINEAITDAPPTDTPGDTPDAGNLVCNMLAVENLNSLGTVAGDTLTYSGNNTATMSSTALGVQVPPTLQQNGACDFKIGHQRVFSYTAHSDSILRVSTTNAATDPGFDTVLVLLPNTQCPRPIRNIIGCNDDDAAYSLDQRRVSSTSVAIQQIRANSTILIALGGFVPVSGARNEAREMGNFVLTVQELAPVAEGGVCDRRRLTDACGDGFTCVSDNWPSDAGHCRANGSVAGAECTISGTTGSCSGAGLTCDQNAGVCVATVAAAGMACDPYHTCGTGLSCVTLESGSSTGICRADGTASGAACRATVPECDTGLLCTTIGTSSFCQAAGVMNGACNTWDGTCPTGQDCVTPTISGREGTCTNTATTPGTHCVSTCTAAGSSCETGANFNICQHDSAAGEACGGYDTCGATNNCFLTDLNNVYNGLCFSPGMLGGTCRTAAPACDGTAVCSNPTDPMNGRCLNSVAEGAACTLLDQCPMNSTCVQDGTGATFMGHCHAQGTAAGAECRTTGTPCDTGLSCSSFIPEEGVCQTTASAGGSCIPRNASIVCPSGQVCRSTSILAGTCAAPTTETEPNDVPAATISAPTTPAAISGGLASFDIDCFRLNVPASSGIYAAVTAPSGVCGGIPSMVELQLSVYKLEGTNLRLLGQDTNSGTFRCPRIDAHDTEFAWARNTTTAPETLYVCVHNGSPTRQPVAAYALSLDVRP